jgi:hypothetical protein
MAFSRVEYWRLATLLPILFPLVTVPVTIGMSLLGAPLPERIAGGITVAFMGVFMFGPVYLVVGAVLLWVLRRSSWRLHAVAAVVAPVLMLLSVAVVSPIMGGGTAWQAVELWGTFCLGLGYFYVGVAFAGMWLVARVGGFSPAA